MTAPSITKNLFKLKKVMQQTKNKDNTVGATGLDIESVLASLGENNGNIESNPLGGIGPTGSSSPFNPR